MNLVAGHTVGIDLGTSYSAVARLGDDGHPAVIRNADGAPITASIVLVESDRRAIVGPSSAQAIEFPERTVAAIKRQMGNADYFRVFDERKLSAEFVSAMILRKLKQDAEREIGPIGNAVITVPYYFTDPARRATVNAGRIAGLNVIDLINEPTAATLAFAWMRGELGRGDGESPERTVLVYDLGGGTFDVTVVRCTATTFAVAATDGDTFLGGLDWTRRIVDHAAEQFRRKFGADPRGEPHALARLTEDCERIKRILSEQQRAILDISFEGRTTTIGISRGDFEKLTADLLQRTRDTTQIVLELAGVRPDELDEVLLVGGSTHIPAVLRMLKAVTGRAPSRALDPQLAVAQGAAIHAAILEARATGGEGRIAAALHKRLRSIVTRDVNSHSLGVEVSEPGAIALRRNHIMIPRNSPLPIEVEREFVTDTPNPEGIRIRLLEGEAADVRACTRVGDLRITHLPENLPAGSPVNVAYRYDERRRIQVTARELTGNNESQVRIVWEGPPHVDTAAAFRKLAEEYQVE
ncbi:MAG: Hsp70 family protein [Planctomycetaceae bacterium]